MKSEEESEELNMTEEELQQWVQEEVNKDELLMQRRAQLAQVEDWVKRKERESTYTRLLYSNACESVLECESVIKGLYGQLGLEYRDTDSEEEGEAKPTEDVIQIPEDEADDQNGEGGNNVTGDANGDYVVIDLGASAPDVSFDEKSKVEELSAGTRLSSEPSVQVRDQTIKNTTVKPVGSSAPPKSFLPVIKTESSVPLSITPPTDVMPPTSFRPVNPQIKMESSPSGSSEPSNIILSNIKSRESPVPISSPSPNDLPHASFRPVSVKTERNLSRSPEHSTTPLPIILTTDSPLSTCGVSSPQILSPALSKSNTPTPSYTSESSSVTTAPTKPEPVGASQTIISEMTTEQNIELPKQLEASVASNKSSVVPTISKVISLNQKTSGESTAMEMAKSTTSVSVNKPSRSVTCTTTQSTPPTQTATSSTTIRTTTATTTITTKPSDAKEAPARVQKEVALKINMTVLGRRRTKTWHQGTLLEIKSTESGNRYKIKFDGDKGKSMLSAHHLACSEPPMLKDLFVGCRVVARYKEEDQSWLHAAVIAEMPDRKNRMRFMVFFDDGSAAYVSLPDLHMVCKPLKNVCDDIEDEVCRSQVEEYLQSYPNSMFVVVRVGQESKAERDGQWEDCTITKVDSSLIQICYTKDNKKEWLYKGSKRLDHIQRIKKRMTEQKTEQPPKKVVCLPNQGNSINIASTTVAASVTMVTAATTAAATTTAAAATTATTTAAITTIATTSARSTTQTVALKPSTPQNISQAVSTKFVLNPAKQPRVVLHRISLPISSSSKLLSKVMPHKEPTLTGLSRSTKRPASVEVDFYQNIPLPVVESRLKYIPHWCCPACVDRMRPKQKNQHRGQNPLLIPLLHGFRRMTARRRVEGKMSFHVFYRAPCGRSMCEMEEVQDYLLDTRCDFLFLDMFCLDPFVLVKRALPPSSMTTRPKVYLPDISQGKEVVPVPCVNEVDFTSPTPLIYTTHRVPAPGVSINTSFEFMVGCDCTDGCRDRSKCSCHQLTIEATSLFTGGPVDGTAGYTHKRLTRYVPTGVYECNPLCRCDPWMCSNRLVQHGQQLRLQVFMTQHKGWGIRCLDDISKGTFVCGFTGKIVTDDMASVDAAKCDNEYLANLDYIEEVEKLKDDYESEAYCSETEEDEHEKKSLVKMTTGSLKKHDMFTGDSSSGEEMDNENQENTEKNKITRSQKQEKKKDENDSSEEEDYEDYEDDMDDEDYKVSADEAGVRSKRRDTDCQRDYNTRRNVKILKVNEGLLTDIHTPLHLKHKDQTEVSPSMAKWMRKKGPGEAVTEFARKSTRNFAIKSTHRVKPQEASMEKPEEKAAPRRRRSTRCLFNDENSCYLIDTKQEGNIGRYINHSCSPNLFVQNVFVDTHDLRFPWVAFFSSKRIRAGTELTWDYGYEVGSVEGKLLLCCCGSSECTGRLL